MVRSLKRSNASSVFALTMDAKEVAQIARPAQNGAEDIVENGDCI
jgi:hypothetical protein